MYDEEGHPSYADFALPGFFDSREEALRQVEVASRMNRDARKRRKHRDEYLNWKSDFLTKREQLIQQTDARDPDLGNIPCQNRKTEAECVGGVLGGECKWSPYKRYWHGILPEFLGGDWQCQPSDIVDDFIDTVCAPKTFGWLTPVEIRDTCIMLGYKLSDFNTQDWAEVTKSMVCEKLRSNLKILRRSDILFETGISHETRARLIQTTAKDYSRNRSFQQVAWKLGSYFYLTRKNIRNFSVVLGIMVAGLQLMKYDEVRQANQLKERGEGIRATKGYQDYGPTATGSIYTKPQKKSISLRRRIFRLLRSFSHTIDLVTSAQSCVLKSDSL